MKNNVRALALVSGGLDSLLAARVVMEQDIEVEGVAFLMQFAAKDLDEFTRDLKQASEEAKIPTRTVDISQEFLSLIKEPDHGFGANMNPCIDCKILMLKTAKKIAEQERFDFIITGEVLGERPMSQRKEALDIIEKRSSLEGFLLRPLSAKLLKRTEAERSGLVNRDRLLDISGRSRKRQFALAGKYGITKYFTPAGGCLLTAEEFSLKLADLLEHNSLNKQQTLLLKYGRHFRVGPRTKVVIGRDREDNQKVKEFKEGNIAFVLENAPGPYGLLIGEDTEKNLQLAANLVLSHSKKKKEPSFSVRYWKEDLGERIIRAKPLKKNELDDLRI